METKMRFPILLGLCTLTDGGAVTP